MILVLTLDSSLCYSERGYFSPQRRNSQHIVVLPSHIKPGQDTAAPQQHQQPFEQRKVQEPAECVGFTKSRYEKEEQLWESLQREHKEEHDMLVKVAESAGHISYTPADLNLDPLPAAPLLDERIL
jgi:hypothetical protein